MNSYNKMFFQLFRREIKDNIENIEDEELAAILIALEDPESEVCLRDIMSLLIGVPTDDLSQVVKEIYEESQIDWQLPKIAPSEE